MAYNKVEYAGKVLVDLTGDTVTSDMLFEGHTAHSKSGEAIVGTFSIEQEITEQDALIEQLKAALADKAAGGATFNYSVIDGVTQPSSATENTIWVDTDVDITGHAFSMFEPENPIEGMVWFTTGTVCNAPFNAHVGNALWVYPTACQQYIGGEWVKKEAKTYQNSTWIDWVLYVFKDGVTSPYIGGWVGWALPYELAWAQNASVPTITVTDVLYASIPTGAGVSGTFRSGNLINVNGFKKLTFWCDSNAASADNDKGNFVCLLPEAATSGADMVASARIANGASGIFEMDISDITGEYYLATIMVSYTKACNITLSRVVLE